MYRFAAIVLLGLAGLITPGVTVAPAAAAPHSQPVDWSQHDTAVYVVSTLNVLRTHRGKPVAAILARRLQVSRFEVWLSLNTSDLYFILLKRADGSTAGQLAYQMGWPRPMSLSPATDQLSIRKAPDKIATAFRSDPKQLIGTFTSTLPR